MEKYCEVASTAQDHWPVQELLCWISVQMDDVDDEHKGQVVIDINGDYDYGYGLTLSYMREETPEEEELRAEEAELRNKNDLARAIATVKRLSDG
jgi:hypothetical protein